MDEKDLPKRKSTRLPHFDYSQGGAYFLTLCMQDRKKILSTVERTEKPVGDDAHGVSQNEQKTGKPVGEGSALPHLTLIGQITQDWLNKINDHFPSAELGEYVIMPNHIHLILFLEDTSGRADPSPTVSNVIGWLKYNITKDVNLPKGQKLFQRSFYDHVIRNRDEYMEICNYITLNPENWENDELYN